MPWNPLYPVFQTCRSRVDTFKSWKIGYALPPTALAAAGFFSLNERDVVMCYYCGLKLRNWLVTDNPIEEHVKWKSSCLHLQTVAEVHVGFDTVDSESARKKLV